MHLYFVPLPLACSEKRLGASVKNSGYVLNLVLLELEFFSQGYDKEMHGKYCIFSLCITPLRPNLTCTQKTNIYFFFLHQWLLEKPFCEIILANN